MRGLSLDLRYGLRALVRRPAFPLSVVLILALGIGANTAIFTVADALLIRPLPYQQPERLVKVWETVHRDTVERRELSYPDYRDLAERATAFAGLAAYADSGAIGKRLQSGQPGGDGIWFTVVGVARDVHYRNLAPAGPGVPDDPDLYLPLDPARASGPAVAVRSALPPAALASSVRSAIAGLDPEVALFSLETMDERIVEQSAESRFSTVILGVFAALALVLAGVGLYSVLAYVVSRRTREIGIRMALGARRAAVLRQVVGEGMTLVGTGVALGLALALALSHLLAGSLYQVSPVERRIRRWWRGLVLCPAGPVPQRVYGAGGTGSR
jgi:FtsX-like permease family